MIWSETDAEVRAKEAQKALCWFAWYPVHLQNGCWCWLEYVRYEFWTNWGSSGYDYFLLRK